MSTVNTKEFHHAHHFESAEHQYSTSKQGIWLFMVTEILMFGGLFVGYAIYHSLYPQVFEKGSSFLSIPMGSLNTVVLIFSSFTMALGINFVQRNKQDKAVIAFIITVLCALTFMIVKYFEYTHKIHDGLLPGKFFHNAEMGALTNGALFFGFYFIMTGLHGLHVIIGAGMIIWVTIGTIKGKYSSEYYTPVEGIGLFWHIVDLVWIYLFPLLYLVG